jgi:hypothetical protein
MNAKEYLTKVLVGKSPEMSQFVELPVWVVREALTGKTFKNVEGLLVAVNGLRDGDKVFQLADDWLLILGEL